MNVINNENVISTVSSRVSSLVNRNRGSWSGTMSELLSKIARNGDETFPASPASLRLVINNATPRLRRAGYSVRFSRTTDRSHKRLVSITTRGR